MAPADRPIAYSPFPDVIDELLIGHARFDQCGTHHRIDLDDLVHPLQVENDLSPVVRCRCTVAEIVTRRDRPDRNLILVADGHDALDLFDRGGGQRRGRRKLLLRFRHHDFPVGDQLFVPQQDAILPQQRSELVDRLLKRLLRHAAGKDGAVLLCHLRELLQGSIRNETKVPVRGGLPVLGTPERAAVACPPPNKASIDPNAAGHDWASAKEL